MNKEIIYAFRLIHILNIPHVLQHGFVHRTSSFADSKYVPIGDQTIIKIRSSRLVGNNYVIGDFIPFYFGPRSPMLYVIQHGYNGVKQYSPEELVYCIIRLDDIEKSPIRCVFTDGHALNMITKWYDKEKLKDINRIVKYDDVYIANWVNEDDRDLKRRKEAELLLLDELPVQYIRGFVVYNEEAKERLQEYGVNLHQIAIRPNYYF